jgi:macrolide transport system ATP-binding/permease protein
VVQVRDLVVDGRLTLARLDVEGGTRLLVTGANGTGKSTLLGVLSGRLRPSAGVVDVHAHRVAELAQDAAFPDRRRPAAMVYADAVAGDERAPALRDLGLLHPRDHQRAVGLLSVGQRRRLALAVALASGPDLLLLDEPTNHLSLALAGELEEALQRAAGTIVVASHDRWLRRRWSEATLDLATAAGGQHAGAGREAGRSPGR